MAKKQGLSSAEERLCLMEKLFQNDELALAEILQKCQEPMELTCTCCGGKRMIYKACKRRWCPECAPMISAQRLSRLEYGARELEWPLFVTLTVPNTHDAQTMFRKLRSSFGKFRRTKFWVHTVTGGMASMEVTNRGNGWHPHLHAVIDCRWLSLDTSQPQRGDSKEIVAKKCKAAQKELANRWAKCLKIEKAVVHVKRTTASILVEVLKYAVKPGDLLKAEGNVGDVIRAMERCRLITTFGSLYGMGAKWKKQEKEDYTPKPCEQCSQSGHWMPSTVVDRITRLEDPRMAACYHPTDPTEKEFVKSIRNKRFVRET